MLIIYETSQLFTAVRTLLKNFPGHTDALFPLSTVLSSTQPSGSSHTLTPTKLKSISTVITDHRCMMGVTAACSTVWWSGVDEQPKNL